MGTVEIRMGPDVSEGDSNPMRVTCGYATPAPGAHDEIAG
jgi:hypothetical protein